MSIVERDTFIWAEKYRPSKISDVIIDQKNKELFSKYVETKQIPHMLLGGPAGIGKTTIARAMCKEIDADMLYINASNESGVDTVRTKIIQFASTASLEDNLKVVLLDEADQLSHQAQGTLRAVMEEFSDTTRFILTCNFKTKIMDAIQSRCVYIDFSVTPEEREALMGLSYKRACAILRHEEVEFDKSTVATIVRRCYPDMRRVMNALQSASASGKIDASALMESTPTEVLYEAMRNKKFGDVRKWIGEHADDWEYIFRDIFDRTNELFVGASIPQVIITLASYMDMTTRSPDPEITLVACISDLMVSVEMKA